jgi:hypothetical protein
MLAPRIPGFLRAIVVVCVVLPTAAAGAGTLGASAPVRAASNTATFQDSTGEDPLGPDITTVVVSNTDAGIISFRVNVPNKPQLGQDMLVDLFVDSDSNAATGDPDTFGADYAIELILGNIALFHWDGTNFTRRPGDPAATSLLFAYNGGATITISADELGNTKQFGFGSSVISGLVVDPTTGDFDFTNAHADFAPAPDAGLYKFQVKTAPPTLLVKKLAISPAKPKAGKLFSAKLTVARSDTGALLQGGRVACVGRIGGASIRAKVQRFVGSQAVCTWSIPATAKGKSFRGSIAVVFEGLRTAKSVSGKIG